MSAIAEAPFDAAAGDRLAKRNALVLATGQALAGANNTVIAATGSILGSMMARTKASPRSRSASWCVGISAGTCRSASSPSASAAAPPMPAARPRAPSPG